MKIYEEFNQLISYTITTRKAQKLKKRYNYGF